jgi:murein DD-endopeptidase MepM/ murein hydrolase activator NlpD
LPHAIRGVLAAARRRPAVDVAPHRDAHPTTRVDRIARAIRPVARRIPRGSADQRLRALAGHPRALPGAMASLVVVAALVSVAPAATGRTPGSGVLGVVGSPRVAAFGGPLRGAAPAPAVGDTTDGTTAGRRLGLDGIRIADESQDALGPFGAEGVRFSMSEPAQPVADGSDRLRSYRIRSGDSLVAIADRFHLKVTTIWWANTLKAVTPLPVGKTLVIPPVDGLVVVVRAGDTLAAIAKRSHVPAATIVDENGLPTTDVATGQTLIVPGGTAAPMPVPPAPKPAPKRAPTPAPAVVVTSGWVFPVVGGGAYISQYFHASHPAIDIAADYGTPVRAAHAGRVTFAGWKNNGGGWQVWISHGGNLYTTYNHMSSLSVSTGQSVGAGQGVGRIGQSGWATGPHCHFEVWRGPIWDGGTRVNPLNYV